MLAKQWLAPLILATSVGLLVAPVLSRADSSDEEAAKVAAYVKELKNKNARIRKQVALALGALGARAKNAIPALRAALLDADDDVKAAAAGALERIGGQKKIEAVAENRLRLRLAEVQAEMKRLQVEQEQLKKLLALRNQTILALEVKYKAMLGRAVELAQAQSAATKSNCHLVEQLERLQKKLAAFETAPKKVAVRHIKGVVTEVLRKGELVKISLGKDAGISEGQILEVYRLKPKREYLGTIKILDADHARSVARLVKTAGDKKDFKINKGDEVVEQIKETGKPEREAKNPPPEYVKGVITKVNKDNLVAISLGTDAGVMKGHTLEVYRLKPKPEYLGTIRIIRAEKSKAVGTLLKTAAGLRRSPLKKGDEVASKILTR